MAGVQITWPLTAPATELRPGSKLLDHHAARTAQTRHDRRRRRPARDAAAGSTGLRRHVASALAEIRTDVTSVEAGGMVSYTFANTGQATLYEVGFNRLLTEPLSGTPLQIAPGTLRHDMALGASAPFSVTIPATVPPGRYRLTHFYGWAASCDTVVSTEAQSEPFDVVAAED